MDILLSGKVFHTLSDLMTHTKTLLSGHHYLQKMLILIPLVKKTLVKCHDFTTVEYSIGASKYTHL